MLPERVAQAVIGLENLAASVIAEDVSGFIVFVQTAEGVSRMWYVTEKSDNEQMATATMEHGRRLHRSVARRQGTAPPNNRSDDDH